MVEPSVLQLVWYCLIVVLWIGFLVLEGFDLGVGMLLPFLSRDDKQRRVLFNSIGSVLDGNEVWLITAGGAMFAAFPGWYATLFSAMYLPFFLILVGLIFRGLAVHYRGKRSDAAWKNRWDWGLCAGSALVSVVLGVGFANFVKGVPPAFYFPWQILTITAVAVCIIIILSAAVSLRRVLFLEPAVVFR